MKNSGLFLNMAKGCFFVCFFFQALMSLCFLSGKVARVLKMLVFFSQFLGLCGVASSCLFGFGRLGVFVFLVFAFLFGVGYVSVCLICFVLWLDVVVSVFVLFFLFFCFLGGFKGQVRWPKEPPHLALNPPYFFSFCFFSCLFLLTWP